MNSDDSNFLQHTDTFGANLRGLGQFISIGVIRRLYFKSIYRKTYYTLGFPGGKEPICQCKRPERRRFQPWVQKIPWRREWLPTPVFLPGESHGQRSLAGYSPRGCKESDMTDGLSTHTLQQFCFPKVTLGFWSYQLGILTDKNTEQSKRDCMVDVVFWILQF